MSDASDDELLGQARAGSAEAFQELYARHRPAALRLARSYRRHGDPEDLVSAAFEKVLAALQRGKGPADSFRAYLFVTLRHLAAHESGRRRDEQLDDVPENVVAVSGLPALDESERRIITQAFEALPDRWQAVLWLTAVEGRHPREVARSAGIPANTVSVLAHRARERLRETYLQAHLQARPVPTCEPHRSRLGGYVRGGLSRRHHTATVAHLEHCASCRELVVELNDVNRQLVRSVLPLYALVSGGGLAPTVAAAAGATAAGAAGGAAGGVIGGTAAVAPASGLTGAAAAAGAGASALKVGAAAVAAVVGLTVSLVPSMRGGDDPGPPALAAQAPPGYDRSTTTGASAPADGSTSNAPQVPGTDAVTSGTESTSTPGTSPSGQALVDVDAGVSVGSLLDVDASIEVGDGLALDVRWTRALLGSGVLKVEVGNTGSAVKGLAVDVQLSGAGSAAPLASACQSGEGGLVGAVLSLVGTLTCTLGNVVSGGTVGIDVPVQVTQQGATATVQLRLGQEVLETRVIDLPVGG